MTKSRKPLVQWTIAELIVVLVIGTFVIGTMWAHRELVWLVMLLAMLLVFCMLTIAFVGRREWRWFGAGFSVFAVGYFLTLVIVERPQEAIPNTLSQLPTTYLLLQCQEALTHTRYELDGKEIPAELEPRVGPLGQVVDRDGNSLGNVHYGPNIPGFIAPPTGSVFLTYTPDPSTYHTLGQTFWMLLFGYVGGKFGVGFARYQVRQETISERNE